MRRTRDALLVENFKLGAEIVRLKAIINKLDNTLQVQISEYNHLRAAVRSLPPHLFDQIRTALNHGKG